MMLSLFEAIFKFCATNHLFELSVSRCSISIPCHHPLKLNCPIIDKASFGTEFKNLSQKWNHLLHSFIRP